MWYLEPYQQTFHWSTLHFELGNIKDQTLEITSLLSYEDLPDVDTSHTILKNHTC